MRFHDASNKAGIYKIRNILNNKCYIGCTKNFEIRYTKHLSSLRNQKGVNKHLQNAWNKYGEENFVFEIIEALDPMEDKKELNKVLNIKEQYWVNIVKPGYNIRTICVNSNLGLSWKISEKAHENRRKAAKRGKDNHISKAVVLVDLEGNFIKEFECGKYCAEYLNIGLANITMNCKRQSRSLKNAYICFYKDEWESIYKNNKQLLLPVLEKAKTENKSKERSISRLNYYANNKECRKQISERQKRPVLQYDLDGNLLNEFDSVLEAKQKTGAKNVSFCCSGRLKTTGGFIFKFKNGGRWNYDVSSTA